MRIKVKIDASKIESNFRLDKLNIVREEMEEIINSDVFRQAVLNIGSIHGETSAFKTDIPEQIYQRFMRGSETLSPEVDHELDIYVDDYFSRKRVIGYTYPSIKTIFVNTRYFDKRSTKLIGSNILHEYSHKLGYKHDFKRTKRRSHSVPYKMNEIYEKCYDYLFPQPKPQKVKVCTGWWIFKKCRWVDA